jgi:subtilase family serine protease
MSNKDSNAIKIIAIGFAVVLALTAFVTFSSYLYSNNKTILINIGNNIAGVYNGKASIIGNLNPNQNLYVLVTLKYNNEAQLNQFLSLVQNPHSRYYHDYLTKQQFVNEYSPNQVQYDTVVSYFASQGIRTTTFPDRVTIQLYGSVAQYESAFHTTISVLKLNKETFYAPTSQVYLPNYIAPLVVGIAGLNTQFRAHFNLHVGSLFTGSGSSQDLYGSDLQVPYQLNQLYKKGYPTTETVATILWGGVDSSGNQVGAFDPSDISSYFQQTLPAGEPKPTIMGYPIDGAAAPGSSSLNDQTQANYESSLDLEMVGSTAPGVTAIEVYGPGNTSGGSMGELDDAFAYILSPPSNASASIRNALSNVVAISNSWGGGDANDSTWQSLEQQAAARGITILVSSGDGGNANGNTSPSFPATVGFNTYGSLAVGGTQAILTGSPSSDGTGTTGFQTQTVWYNSPNPGAGSQGGDSVMFAEPSWQKASADANSQITANPTNGVVGRGTPDISAIGANMEMEVGGQMQPIWGTSVASPLAAGVVATMDYYMGKNLGFMDPLVYQLGQAEVNGTYKNAPPFYFVSNGSNGAFSARNGYSLAVGWGSINAYNFVQAAEGISSTPPASTPTNYTITFHGTGLPSGISYSVTLGGTTKTSSGGQIVFTEPNGSYPYTVTPPSGYTATPSSGTANVNGMANDITITFTKTSSPLPQTYAVTFIASGLPSNQSFSVTLNGATQASAQGQVSFTEPNGTYQYTVTSPSGYNATPSSGTITVNGQAVSTTINFTQTSTPSPSPSPSPSPTSPGVYSQVNATSANIQYYGLPGSEEFKVNTTVTVNYVVLLLEGTGTIQFSIGTTLNGTDVVGMTNVNVNSANSGTYVMVTFTGVTLKGGTNYYLNVYDPNYTGVQWGYTSSPSISQGAVQDYYYTSSGLMHDNQFPDIYAIGYISNANAAVITMHISMNPVTMNLPIHVQKLAIVKNF